MAEKLFLHCSVHGTSSRRAACPLSAQARRAWRDVVRRGEARVMITVVMANDPAHGAVCASEDSALGSLLGADETQRMALSALKSSIRSGKLKKTKAAKRKSA